MSTVATLRSLKELPVNSCYSFVASLVLLGGFWMLSTHWVVAQITTHEMIPAQPYLVDMGLSKQTQSNVLMSFDLQFAQKQRGVNQMGHQLPQARRLFELHIPRSPLAERKFITPANRLRAMFTLLLSRVWIWCNVDKHNKLIL